MWVSCSPGGEPLIYTLEELRNKNHRKKDFYTFKSFDPNIKINIERQQKTAKTITAYYYS